MKNRTTRKLAAIMFTDIEGYTALMQQSESKAMEVRKKHREVFESITSDHSGQIIAYYGDGTLSIYDSAVFAVQSAIEMQKRFREAPPIPVRIGLHMGDIVLTEEDIVGHAVNLASRVESLAVSGSVLISDTIIPELKNQEQIKFKSLGYFHLKNDEKPREIFGIKEAGLVFPKKGDLKGKVQQPDENIPIHKKVLTILQTKRGKAGLMASLLIILLLAFGINLISKYQKEQRVRTEWIPQIQKHLEAEDIKSAYHLAEKAEEIIPDDPILMGLFDIMSSSIDLKSTPNGVKVYRNDDLSNEDAWEFVGTTPLEDFRVYDGFSYWRFEKEGYQTRQIMAYANYIKVEDNTSEVITGMLLDNEIELFPLDEVPEGMVFVKGGSRWWVGLNKLRNPPPPVGDFWMDKYEVTNLEFLEFVRAGGYENPTYWSESFLFQGQLISFNEAKKLFVDQTGIPGPSTWIGGKYRAGQDDFPVSGISWYEAAAYAKFVGKSLPTLFHWNAAGMTAWDAVFTYNSNYASDGPIKVGSNNSAGPFGTYDLAGNVREWTQTSYLREQEKFILGGGWSDPGYAYSYAESHDPFDRSVINGFRCIIDRNDPEKFRKVYEGVDNIYEYRTNFEPVDDQTFSIFLKQFSYEKAPFNAEPVENQNCYADWTCERVQIDVAYDKDRMNINMFFPVNTSPPYQTIIYFPGSDVHIQNSSNPLHNRHYQEIEFLVNRGCAVILPVYYTTFERATGFYNDFQAETQEYKEHLIKWVKDFSRTIDYLETRPEIDTSRIGFYGFSWGGALAGVIPAAEKRIKAVITNVGGLDLQPAFEEVDQINYLPRITQPFLMINGEFDSFYPFETSQKPFFNLLGTPENDKRMVVFEDGHFAPKVDVIKECHAFLDKYFGPVKRKDIE